MNVQFLLGTCLITPAASEVLADAGLSPITYIRRHHAGDWGDIPDDDKGQNESALALGARLMSVYKLPGGAVIWIVTEADRRSTTVLTPDDY